MLLVFIPIIALLCSCASIPDEAAGINKAEMRALKENYYWEQKNDPPRFGPGELAALLNRSANPWL
jgi:hypothetical protein